MSSLTDTLLNIPGPGGTLPIIEPPTQEATEPPTTRATGPSSQIDPTLPVFGNPTTQSVRQNFATAQVEITGLMQATVGSPFLALAGGKMTGPMYVYNDPTDVMMPVTLGYFQTHGGGGPGAGGIPEAPSDGAFYLRSQGAWVPGVALSGGTVCQMTGELLLAGNPADALGAVPKQYADAIATTANGAVMRGGDIMTGLLTLSGDPSAPLGAVTKQYADNALALKANAANPTFTGIVTVASNGRVIVQGPTNPSVTLYNTTAGQPCYGVYNSGGYLGFGLAVAATGNPNGAPFATMDQNGNFLFATRVNVTGGRLISSLAGVPSITLNATGQGNIFCLFTGPTSNLLGFGLADASGAPQSSVMQMDGIGNLWSNSLTVAAGVTASNGNIAGLNLSASSGIFAPGGSQITNNGGGWTWNTSGGNYGFTCHPPTDPVFLFQSTAGTLFSITSGGVIFASGSIGTNGNVNGHDFVINGTGAFFTNQGNGNYYQLRWDGSSLYCWVNSYGYIGLATPSGRAIKRDVAPVEDYDALTAINAIPFYSYDAPGATLDDDGNWTESAHHECGWIAEDLETLIPNSVDRISPTDEGKEADPTLEDVLHPQWQPILTYAVRAIQQLNERIAALEGARQ